MACSMLFGILVPYPANSILVSTSIALAVLLIFCATAFGFVDRIRGSMFRTHLIPMHSDTL